jgi:polyferredoxin
MHFIPLSRAAWILVAVFGTIVVFTDILYPGRFPKLPGDIYIEKYGFRIYIPWLSSLIITLIASIFLGQFFHS